MTRHDVTKKLRVSYTDHHYNHGWYHIILLLLGLFSVLNVGRSQGIGARGDSYYVKLVLIPVLLRGVILNMAA